MIRIILFILFKFYLGAEAGASLPWSQKWQSKKVLGFTLQQLPEALDAAILAFMAMEGYRSIGLSVALHYEIAILIGVFLIIYAGIQSATWMFLRWESHEDPNTERTSTTKPVVDWIANKFGWKLGDEGYSWVAATVKGTIITLPLGGLGGILFALGYECGSHFKRKFGSQYHWVSEGLSFVGVGVYCLICNYLIGFFGWIN